MGTSAGVTTPRVVIKADIEGAELKIIPDMVVTGAFGHVDNLHMEWHGNASYRQGREAAMISKLAPAITALSMIQFLLMIKDHTYMRLNILVVTWVPTKLISIISLILSIEQSIQW